MPLCSKGYLYTEPRGRTNYRAFECIPPVEVLHHTTLKSAVSLLPAFFPASCHNCFSQLHFHFLYHKICRICSNHFKNLFNCSLVHTLHQFPKFHENPPTTFYIILLTNRQTNKQINKQTAVKTVPPPKVVEIINTVNICFGHGRRRTQF